MKETHWYLYLIRTNFMRIISRLVLAVCLYNWVTRGIDNCQQHTARRPSMQMEKSIQLKETEGKKCEQATLFTVETPVRIWLLWAPTSPWSPTVIPSVSPQTAAVFNSVVRYNLPSAFFYSHPHFYLSLPSPSSPTPTSTLRNAVT